ncbi:Yip1 domain-containing protein [uncultured Gammaproteobacteria bacterium]
MPTLHEICQGLIGSYRLARLDRSGMSLFDTSAAGALRSFFAALLVLPSYILLFLLRQPEQLTTPPLDWIVVVETLAYVVSWTAYPVLMIWLTRFLDRGQRFTGFLAAYNWSAPIQMMVYLPVMAIAQAGILPDGLGESLTLAVTLGLLAYQWFITQVALDLPPSTSSALVLLDFILSMFISGYTEALLAL